MRQIYRASIFQRLIAPVRPVFWIFWFFIPYLHTTIGVAALAAITLSLAVYFFTDKIIFTDDSVEQRNFFGSRLFHHDEIAGWAVIRQNHLFSYIYALKIYPAHKARWKCIYINSKTPIDKKFASWLLNFPNLTINPRIERLRTNPEYAGKYSTPESIQELNEINPKAYMSPEDITDRYFNRWLGGTNGS